MATAQKKKVVKVTSKSAAKRSSKGRKSKTTKRNSSKDAPLSSILEGELVYGKKHYILMLTGIGLLILGFILMSGGAMPSPDVWEADRIYSFRRITLAPIVILSGLALQVYAIFKK